ncbi:MAG: methionine--tRNA ligase [Spirochaetaceae bacterium]|nr:MAG: methionine--tRNA ligase [Spirochaetaceae bacterium]
MKKILITSALPYVNNIPHLGNLIQVLSADVYARYCRLRGYDTLYVCGTDEYGTATETRALEEGITPQELCDRYYKVHADVYEWFNIAFDSFGRTSTPKHTEITQSIFLGLDENGYIKEKTVEQTYCENCDRFLADRYVRGVCPHCGYPEARGDQCENCGKLLDPTDLLEPKCGVCGSTPVVRETSHLYIDLPAIRPQLEAWMERTSQEGAWARNAVQMTQAWIRDGLHERAITRDLKWGIPVPKEGYENKVFYVWFDAPIGYISITANLTDQWQRWWKNPEEVKLVQFIGKDNIPFHTVIFPCSLIGSGESWTLLHSMSSSEYLNYESGKFSKSKGVGVFGTDAVESGIPADVWRFYLFYNRPEKADAQFAWNDFQEKVNGELIGNLANLVNRTLTFVNRYFEGRLRAPERGKEPELPRAPEGGAAESSATFWQEVRQAEAEILDALERIELRDGLRRIFALSSIGNKRFQDEEPWKLVKEDPGKTALLLRDLVYLIRDLAVLIHPYLPSTAERIHGFLGTEGSGTEQLGALSGIEAVGAPELLFRKLEDQEIESFKNKFSGGKAMTAHSKNIEKFLSRVSLKVARIVEVEKHPKADKLYIETVDLGGETRQIVSGLVPYYRSEELKGRNVLLVTNLKPARLRGVESQGMLLAADDGKTVEVLFADHAQPGDAVGLGGRAGQADLKGRAAAASQQAQIDIEEFFSIPIEVKDGQAMIDGIPLECAGKTVTTDKVKTGQVR